MADESKISAKKLAEFMLQINQTIVNNEELPAFMATIRKDGNVGIYMANNMPKKHMVQIMRDIVKKEESGIVVVPFLKKM